MAIRLSRRAFSSLGGLFLLLGLTHGLIERSTERIRGPQPFVLQSAAGHDVEKEQTTPGLRSEAGRETLPYWLVLTLRSPLGLTLKGCGGSPPSVITVLPSLRVMPAAQACLEPSLAWNAVTVISSWASSMAL
jgi:hypothetical protein